MRELNVDKVEITCLKAIFLFDPGKKNRLGVSSKLFFFRLL